MHRTKCTAIIKSVLAPYFREELKENIGKSPYSLYLDEDRRQPEIVSKLLCICVKYRSQKHGKFVSTSLGLVELLDTNANGILDAIVAFLRECGLDIKNMVGIATDGASVMVGKNDSVFTLLRQKQSSVQLTAMFATYWILLLTKLEYMIIETYNWFAHSAKCQNDYKNIYKTINDGGCPLN